MLQFHPHQRLCIADIVGHPWLTSGPSATPEQVFVEFARRQQVNKQRAREEEERKNAQRNQVNNMARRDLNVGGKVYLSHGEEAVAATQEEIVHLQLKQMSPSQNTTHSFFSSFSPDVLLEQLTQKLREQGQTFEISNNSWKLSFNCTRNSEPSEENENIIKIAE